MLPQTFTQLEDVKEVAHSDEAIKMQFLAKAASEDAVTEIGPNKVHVSQLASSAIRQQLCGGLGTCIIAYVPPADLGVHSR